MKSSTLTVITGIVLAVLGASSLIMFRASVPSAPEHVEVAEHAEVRDSPPPPSADQASSTSVQFVDRILRELDWGNIVFSASSAMRYERTQSVELLLSPSLSVAALQAQLEQNVGAESSQARVSNRMEAQLTGRGFAIEALTPALQAVTSQQVTRWRWQATPTEHGRQTLHLVLSAHIDVAGRDAPLVIRTFERDIQVEITVPQRVSGFVQKNWQWLWVTIVVPIAGYLWKRRKDQLAEPKRSAV